MIGGKKKGAEETKKEEAKKEEIKFDPITPETLMVGKQFGKANKKFAKVVVTYSCCQHYLADLVLYRGEGGVPIC